MSQDGENPMDSSYIKNKYNIGIDKEHTVFATIQFLLILLRNGDKVATFFDKEPQIGRFGGPNTFILTKGAKQTEFKQYKCKNVNNLYLIMENDKLIIGDSALTIFKTLLRAATTPSEQFGSPELFSGVRYDKFVEQSVEDVEVIRFIVGEATSE